DSGRVVERETKVQKKEGRWTDGLHRRTEGREGVFRSALLDSRERIGEWLSAAMAAASRPIGRGYVQQICLFQYWNKHIVTPKGNISSCRLRAKGKSKATTGAARTLCCYLYLMF